MADHAARLGATRSRSTLLVLFLPSHARDGQPIAQDDWVRQSLETLGRLFGGATAFPRGQGVWRDDAQGGKLLYDEPVVIQCYTGEELVNRHTDALREFLLRLGTETRQGAVGFVVDHDYYEFRFPLTAEQE